MTSGELHVVAGLRMEKDGIHRATVARDVDNFVVEIKAQAPRPIAGRDATPLVILNQMENGHSYTFWARDKLGIAEIARQARGANDPQVLSEPVYLLRFPIRVGTTWDTREPTRVSDDEEIVMTGTAQIAAVDESVTVPAGTFRRCIRIDAESSGHHLVPHLNGRDIDGEAEVQLNTSTWLAPDVGPVKATVRETMRPSSLGSAEQTLELVYFKPR